MADGRTACDKGPPGTDMVTDRPKEHHAHHDSRYRRHHRLGTVHLAKYGRSPRLTGPAAGRMPLSVSRSNEYVSRTVAGVAVPRSLAQSAWIRRRGRPGRVEAPEGA